MEDVLHFDEASFRIPFTSSQLDDPILPVALIESTVRGKIFVFCGLPGAGKGTFCHEIAGKLGMIHVSTGDLFRTEVKKQSKIGQIIHGFMSSGQFVPSEYANQILANRLAQADAMNGVLLDGFPRAIEHLFDLDLILRELPLILEDVIYLDITEEECIRRISGRRVCPACGGSYNIHYHDLKGVPDNNASTLYTCLFCVSVTLTQRSDDQTEIVRNRFLLAKEHMKPLLIELRKRDMLHVINTTSSSIPRATEKIIEIMHYPDRFRNLRNYHAYDKLALHLSALETRMKPQEFVVLSEVKDSDRFQTIHFDPNNIFTDQFALYQPLARAFRIEALEENLAQRTGYMRRYVYLSTSNQQKYQEFVKTFSRYGIEVLQIPPTSNHLFIYALLLDKEDKSLVPLAVLREESSLVKPHTLSKASSLRPGVLVDHVSVLTAFTVTNIIDKQKDSNSRNSFDKSYCSGFSNSQDLSLTSSEMTYGLLRKDYQHVTHGRIKCTSEQIPSQSNSSATSQWNLLISVFGWDDIFVLLSTNQSYHYHRVRDNLKISSRDMVLSAFLKDKVYYKQLKSLHHMPIEISRAVDFHSIDFFEFIYREELYNTSEMKRYNLDKLLCRVINEGIFFKGADTRLELNYWQPGLNAGIPLTSKKDHVIHERTFMFHDFGHFLMKDLIFTGKNTPLYRNVYIIQRMISEAVTIMLADGLFVDSIFKSNIFKDDRYRNTNGSLYDFSTRKIYPVFCDMAFDFDQYDLNDQNDTQNFLIALRQMLKASVDYTLKGSYQTFVDLISLNEKSLENLEAYKHKFKSFFVSDFQWTAHNYENMARRSSELKLWWELTSPMRKLLASNGLDIALETIEDFIGKFATDLRLNSTEKSAQESSERQHWPLIDAVFDAVFHHRIAPVFAQGSLLAPDAPELRLKRSFMRYMIVQSGIFARYHEIFESKGYLDRIVASLTELVAAKDLATVGRLLDSVRATYEEYLALLLEKNLISVDDMHNFKEIYPLFEPFYVTYDRLEEYPDLAKVSYDVLSMQSIFEHRIEMAEKTVNRKFTTDEKKYYQHMATMIDHSGGQIEQGIYVTKPGVMLISTDQLVMPLPDSTHITASDLSTQHASFLICGISIETSLELVAHSEASVARLTSSKTNAMNVPFMSVQGALPRHNMSYLNQLQHLRTLFELHERPRERWHRGGELFNMTNAGCKCTAMVYTMNLVDFHKLFIGRMGESGNEFEVQNVVKDMAIQLRSRYPNTILSLEEYLGMANGEKYKLNTISGPQQQIGMLASEAQKASLNGCIQLAVSKLTTEAKILFSSMKIDTTQIEAYQLAEFCSRITYLSFAGQAARSGNSEAYLHKMVYTYQHMSVFSAFKVTIGIRIRDLKLLHQLQISAVSSGGSWSLQLTSSEELRLAIVTMSLKQWVKWTKALKESPLSTGVGANLGQLLSLHYPLLFTQ